MFVWLLHFKGFFLYALLFYIKNVGCGPLFMSVHPNIYYRTVFFFKFKLDITKYEKYYYFL